MFFFDLAERRSRCGFVTYWGHWWIDFDSATILLQISWSGIFTTLIKCCLTCGWVFHHQIRLANLATATDLSMWLIRMQCRRLQGFFSLSFYYLLLIGIILLGVVLCIVKVIGIWVIVVFFIIVVLVVFLFIFIVGIVVFIQLIWSVFIFCHRWIFWLLIQLSRSPYNSLIQQRFLRHLLIVWFHFRWALICFVFGLLSLFF